MKLIMIALFSLVPLFAQAEEKECTVKGMHCDACKDMVSDRVCNDTFEVCTVTVKDKLGKIHLKTKDTKAKIDEKAIAKNIEDTQYKLDKCTALKGKSTM